MLKLLKWTGLIISIFSFIYASYLYWKDSSGSGVFAIVGAVSGVISALIVLLDNKTKENVTLNQKSGKNSTNVQSTGKVTIKNINLKK